YITYSYFCFLYCFSHFFFLIHTFTIFTLFPYTTLFRSFPEKGLQNTCYKVLRDAHYPVVHPYTDEGKEKIPPIYKAHFEDIFSRSEEHTSELQSPDHLVCLLLLEKNNTI